MPEIQNMLPLNSLSNFLKIGEMDELWYMRVRTNERPLDPYTLLLKWKEFLVMKGSRALVGRLGKG